MEYQSHLLFVSFFLYPFLIYRAIEELTVMKDKEERELEQIYSSLKDETADLQIALEKKQQELMPWSKKLNEQQSRYDITKSERDLLSERYENAKKKLEQVQQTLKEFKVSFPNTQKSLANARKELEECNRKLGATSEEVRERVHLLLIGNEY